ncbi:MAG: hypothetical protein ACKOAZ_00990 [Ilumatobacteraceae bacterium]
MARTDTPPLRALRRAAAAVLVLPAVAAMAACGNSDGAADTWMTPTAPGIGSLPAGTVGTLPGPLGTEEPATTAVMPPATGSGELQSGPVQIDVTVGVNSGPGRIEMVTIGSEITLNITNLSAADEFHVHGIDLDRSVDAGVMATFNFVVSAAGTYEVESHVTGEVLVVIEAA